MALRTPLSVTPHLYMGDSTGRPLDMGTVYFGEQDKDPEFYPINLFSDDALTKPLAQPVHTKGGYLYDKGDMVEPHAKELIYSVKVLDSYGRKVFYKGAMMRNSWNDDVIEQINEALVSTAEQSAQIATDVAKEIADKAVISSGFVTIDNFEQGATITQRNQALRHAADGKLYRWAGGLPKVVPENSTPTSSGGIGANAWLEVSDATLRQDIVTGGLVTDELIKTAPIAAGAIDRSQHDKNKRLASVFDFGVVGDGSDETEKLRKYHGYCNANNIATSYSGLTTLSLQADANIDINTDHDFAGCEIRLLNSISTNGDRYTTYRIYDPETPLYTVEGSVPEGRLRLWSLTPTAGLFNGTGYVRLESQKPVCGRYYEDETLKFSQPFWCVNGEVVNPLATNLSYHSANIKLTIRDASKKRLRITNLCLVDDGFNRQTILRFERNQVDFKGFKVIRENTSLTDTIDTLLSWASVGNCTAEDFSFNARPYESAGTYVMSMYSTAEITFRNIYGLDGNQTGSTWGVTGSNYVSGCYLHNCYFNRFDVHAMGFFVHVYGGGFRDKGCLQIGSGGGVFEVTGTKVINSPAFRLRGDYGGHLENATILVENVTWLPATATSMETSNNSISLVDLGVGLAGMGGKAHVKAPNVTIRDINIIKEIRDYTENSCKLITLAINPQALSVASFDNLDVSGINLPTKMTWHMELALIGLSKRDYTSGPNGILKSAFINLRNIKGDSTLSNPNVPNGIYDKGTEDNIASNGNTRQKIKVQNVDAFALKVEGGNVIASLDVLASSITYIYTGIYKTDYLISDCTFNATTHATNLLKLPEAFDSKTSSIYNSRFTGSAAYDLTSLTSIMGVQVNSASTLPSNCTAEDAYYGWHKTLVNPNKSTV